MGAFGLMIGMMVASALAGVWQQRLANKSTERMGQKQIDMANKLRMEERGAVEKATAGERSRQEVALKRAVQMKAASDANARGQGMVDQSAMGLMQALSDPTPRTAAPLTPDAQQQLAMMDPGMRQQVINHSVGTPTNLQQLVRRYGNTQPSTEA